MQVEPLEFKATPNQTLTVEESSSILAVNEFRNVLVDCSGITGKLDEETLLAVIAGFEFACKTDRSAENPYGIGKPLGYAAQR